MGDGHRRPEANSIMANICEDGCAVGYHWEQWEPGYFVNEGDIVGATGLEADERFGWCPWCGRNLIAYWKELVERGQTNHR